MEDDPWHEVRELEVDARTRQGGGRSVEAEAV